jgi:hypothetical protein
MLAQIRAAVAAIAIAHAGGDPVSGLRGYEGEPSAKIDVKIENGEVDGYDYTGGCRISGKIPDLYHYCAGARIEFKPGEAGRYDGYDYSAGCRFEVRVNGQNADVYDYCEQKHFSYAA